MATHARIHELLAAVEEPAFLPAISSPSLPSLDSFALGGGITVDSYLRIRPDGLRIGDDMKGLIETLTVTIDMLEVAPVYMSRHEISGSTIFIKSYDGVFTPRGETYREIVAERSQIPGSKNSGIYRTVEIPCVLAEDIKDPKSPLMFEAGTILGLTPSLTGFGEFQRFYRRLGKIDPELLTANLIVRLVHKQRTNQHRNEWGVVEFEYIGAAEA